MGEGPSSPPPVCPITIHHPPQHQQPGIACKVLSVGRQKVKGAKGGGKGGAGGVRKVGVGARGSGVSKGAARWRHTGTSLTATTTTGRCGGNYHGTQNTRGCSRPATTPVAVCPSGSRRFLSQYHPPGVRVGVLGVGGSRRGVRGGRWQCWGE